MASQSVQVVPLSAATAPSTAGSSSIVPVAGTSANSSTTTTPVTITSSIVEELMDESCSDDGLPENGPNRWFFTKEQLENTPSRRAGVDSDRELMYRQQSANFIQDIGQRLQVNQLCINTAIVYMHRFYMFHSFTVYHRNSISAASVFLAAKVEEQPRKLEYVIRVAHYCLFRDTQPQIDLKSEAYANLAAELVSNENILLQTLGFDVGIDHPHTHVVKCCQLVRASKDLAQTSYFMATNSLHLTTMCLEYKSSVVACVCIHLACKWSNWEIPRSKEGKDWFWYVDGTVTLEQLEQYTNEFLTIFNKSPSRLKKKIISLSAATRGNSGNLSAFPSHFNLDPSSPGMPQFTKSRSPSPTETANAGKLRLPPKSNAPQPLFKPIVKPSVPGQPHPVNKPPHPVSGSGGTGHPSHTAPPPPPMYRPNAHPGPAHPVPAKPGHPYPSGPHPGPPHGDPKTLLKQGAFPPSGHHPAPSGMVQNSHPAAARPQPVHQNNTQGHQPSFSHPPPGPKPGMHPTPAVQVGNNVQHGVNLHPNLQNQRQSLTGVQQLLQQPRPHHLNPARPNAPPPPSIRPLMGSQSQPLKRPYPDPQQRPENRPDLSVKRETVVRFSPPNHMGQSQIRPMNPIRPRIPDKPEIRHQVGQPALAPSHQAPQTPVTKLPPAMDGRPWMDRFLDNNDIANSHKDVPAKPPVVAPKPPQLPQLHVSSGLPPLQSQSAHSVSSFHVSSKSSTVPSVTTSVPPQPTATVSLMPIPPNVMTLSLTPSPSIASSSASDSVGSEKRKKEKKHKKDKHRDKEEKEHKHKHKEKHKKEHKDKHKDKHKKHRPSEDFTIDAGNNKLKIIIGRNPNAAAQNSKDSNSKASKHSKDHHTATIINY